MSLSDSDSSSYGGEYRNFKQISRDREFSLPFILLLFVFSFQIDSIRYLLFFFLPVLICNQRFVVVELSELIVETSDCLRFQFEMVFGIFSHAQALVFLAINSYNVSIFSNHGRKWDFFWLISLLDVLEWIQRND